MSKPTLHQFYLGLIPNLINEVIFFIPENEIREDIIDKLDFLKKVDAFNKIYIIDYYQGPVEYLKGRNNKHFFLKESYLEKNIFSLLEKKSDVKKHEFSYVLDKYFELVETLFYATNWMNSNLNQIAKKNDDGFGMFYLQYMNYKKHFETLVKTFYPSKEIIPKGKFNATELIDTYIPDITNEYNKSTNSTTTNQAHTEKVKQANKLQLKKTKKQPLITEAEAESVLLERLFNLKNEK